MSDSSPNYLGPVAAKLWNNNNAFNKRLLTFNKKLLPCNSKSAFSKGKQAPRAPREVQCGNCAFFRMDESDEWQLVFSTRIIITQHPSTPSAARKAPHKQVETIVMFTWTAFFPFHFYFFPLGALSIR